MGPELAIVGDVRARIAETNPSFQRVNAQVMKVLILKSSDINKDMLCSDCKKIREGASNTSEKM